MLYKTVLLELLTQYPRLYEPLRQQRTLLAMLDRLALMLKAHHQEWMSTLRQTRPGSAPAQLASEALELAMAEMHDHLHSASELSEVDEGTLPLDAILRNLALHTQPE